MADRNLRIRMIFDAAERVTGKLKAIGLGSRATAADIKQTRDRLRELDRTQADMSSFRLLKADLKTTEAALAAAQTRVAQLAREMNATDSPTKKLSADLARAKREAAGLKDTLGSQAAELQQLRGRLSDAGVSTQRLAEHERDLRTQISRTNQELAEQTRRFGAAEDRRARFARGRESFGRIQGAATGLAAGGASAIGTGVAMATPIVGAEYETREFESVMTDIGQKANLTREEARKMGLSLLIAAKAANQMPESLQQGVDILSGFGLDPRQAVQMMTPIGRAATAYKAEIADLSAAGFAGVDNLKVPIAQTAKMIDVMALAGKQGAFEVRDMAAHFPALTASAQALGQQGVPAVADLAAALQITRKGAGDSSTAANNLLNLLNKINTEDTIKNFKEFGIDLPKAMKQAAKDGKSPIEAIIALTKQATKGDLSKLAFLFGDMQVQAALRPLIQNVEEYKQIRADALAADGVVDSDFGNRLVDSAQKAERFKIQMRLVRQTVGDLLQPAFDMARDRLTALGERFNSFAKSNPQAAEFILKFAAGLAAVLVISGGVAIAIAGMLAPFAALSWTSAAVGLKFMHFAKVLSFLSKGIWGLATTVLRAGAFMLANPMVAGIMLLIAAVAFAGYMIWKHWDTIKAAFWGAVGAIGGALQAAWNWVKGTFSSILGFLSSLGGRFLAMGQNLIQGLINGVTGKLAALKSTIVNAASSAANWFKRKLDINSPSRVFMSFGGSMMEGVDVGIRKQEAAPLDRLTRLSRSMAAAMAVSAATPTFAFDAAAQVPIQRGSVLTGLAAPGARGGAGQGLAAAPMNVTIIIQQQPGQNDQDLARLVRSEIEQFDRNRLARSRSTFADTPDWTG